MAWFTHILNQPLINWRKGARVAGCLHFTDEAIGTIYTATVQQHRGKMGEAISGMLTIQHGQGNGHQVHTWHLSSWGWQSRQTESDSAHGNNDLYQLNLEVTVISYTFITLPPCYSQTHPSYTPNWGSRCLINRGLWETWWLLSWLHWWRRHQWNGLCDCCVQHWTCLRISEAVMKYCATNNLMGKRFISLTVPYNSSSPKAVRAGTQTAQEPGGRSRCRGREGVLPTGLLLRLAQLGSV